MLRSPPFDDYDDDADISNVPIILLHSRLIIKSVFVWVCVGHGLLNDQCFFPSFFYTDVYVKDVHT